MDLEYGPEYYDFRSEVINFIKENEVRRFDKQVQRERNYIN